MPPPRRHCRRSGSLSGVRSWLAAAAIVRCTSANQTVTILYKRLYNLYNLYNIKQHCHAPRDQARVSRFKYLSESCLSQASLFDKFLWAAARPVCLLGLFTFCLVRPGQQHHWALLSFGPVPIRGTLALIPGELSVTRAASRRLGQLPDSYSESLLHRDWAWRQSHSACKFGPRQAAYSELPYHRDASCKGPLARTA